MTTKLETLPERQSSQPILRSLAWAAPLAMASSTVANLGLYAAAGQIFPEVTAWSGASAEQVVGANIVYLLIGTLVFAAVARFSSRPVRHYIVIATLGLLLSLLLPISAGFGYGPPETPPASVSTVVTLSLMHVMSYAITLPLYSRLVQQ